jgi:pimeloyl-ACP methyl ester carboxylesterase
MPPGSRAHVLGVSLGGMIAQELALAHPERVATLVLAATYARAGDEARDLGARLVALRPQLELQSLLDHASVDARQVYQFIVPLLFSPTYIIEQATYLAQLQSRLMAYKQPFQAFFAQLAAALSHDTSARLPSLRTPTLVLGGAVDRVLPPHYSSELAALVPGARLVELDNGQHGMCLELAAAFNAAVLDFVAKNPIATS